MKKNFFFNLKACLIIAFVFFTQLTISQEIVIEKEIIENTINCRQFDVKLSIEGSPTIKPQEVVLLIDNSGSMADQVTVDGTTKTLLQFAQEAAVDFVNNIFDSSNDPFGKNRVAIVSYNSFANTEINLTLGSSKQTIINEINSIVSGGSTNMEDALIKAKEVLSPPAPQATFDCTTSRSIILLTDGVARWHNGLGTNVTGNGQCNDTTIDTACQTRAFTAATDVENFTVNGDSYDQQIFTVGFTGTLSSAQLAVSQHTLNTIENSGAFYTNNAADLTSIYNTILGQLLAAATAVDGESLVSDQIPNGFSIVPNTLMTSKGSYTITGQKIDWFIDKVLNETVTLEYSIVASEDECGITDPGTSTMKYQNSQCVIVEEVFQNPQVCVPCPEATANLTRNGCNTIDYSATINQLSCTPTANNYSWKFFLNDVQIGTSNTESGSYTYTGSEDFTGNFKAELVYNGIYESNCPAEAANDESTIVLPALLSISEIISESSCAGTNDGEINISVSGGEGSYTYSWSDGPNTEDRTGLVDGDYTVTVTDENDCEITKTITVAAKDILAPAKPILSDESFNCSATPTAPTTTDVCEGIITGTTTTVFPITTKGTTVVTWTFTDSSGNSTTATQNIIVSCIADLSLNISVNNALPKVGETIFYTLKLKNDGPVDAHGIEVLNALPTGLTYNGTGSTIPTGTTFNNTSGIWDLKNITVANGDVVELILAVTVNGAGTFSNNAEIILDNEDDNDSTPNNEI